MSLLEQHEQPMRWGRAFGCGVFGAMLMMSFIDIYYMMGTTPFSYELYLGSLLRGTMYGQQNWVVGFFVNLGVGGVFGCFYAWAFEWVFKRSGVRIGTGLGLLHAAVTAVAVFPFFNTLHAEAGTGLYPYFGFFGSGLGASTPILLLAGNLMFGATVGLFYGPVRAYRVRARAYEPGELGMPGELDVLESAEDHPGSRLIYRVGG